MVEHTFSVGREEKHRIRINHSATTGKASVIVDGHTVVVVNGRGLRPVSQAIDAISISFNIGETERHKVSIRVRGVYWNHFEAYSDGELVYRSVTKGQEKSAPR